jgi:magnesium/cobalt transport protein CorA
VLTFRALARHLIGPARLAEPASRLRQQGADFLAYALVDTIVDNYFAVLEGIGDRIEELEDLVVAAPDREALTAIYEVKRTLAELRRAIWPLRDALGTLARGDSPRVTAPTLPYLRDVADHAIRTLDTIETYRDTAATLIDMYMSSVSNRLNDVMRVLTVIATVFIPLTFIVGIYGMNFVRASSRGAGATAASDRHGERLAGLLGLLSRRRAALTLRRRPDLASGVPATMDSGF